jgi:hypothetical protein
MAQTRTPQVHRVRIHVVKDDVFVKSKIEVPVGRDKKLTAKHLSNAQADIGVSGDLHNDRHAIIVLGDKPAVFVNGRLHDHEDPAVHRKTILPVFTESDVIEWRADQRFEITSVGKPAHPEFAQQGTPDQPFYENPPYRSSASNGQHIARSSKIKREANGQQYKVNIKIGDRDVDPDFVCGDPPPNP